MVQASQPADFSGAGLGNCGSCVPSFRTKVCEYWDRNGQTTAA